MTMSEDQRKIHAWRNEHYNKKGFKSQNDYNETLRIENEIQIGVLRGESPRARATALELQSRLHFGPSRAQAIAGEWFIQKEVLSRTKPEDFEKECRFLKIPESVIKELKHE